MLSARSSAVARAVVPRAGRTYATTAAVAASPRPPVQLFGVDGTYASALYIASAKTSSLEATDKTLQTLQALLKRDPKLTPIISSPTLNAQRKSLIISEITKSISSDKTVKNFLEVLAENNRLGLLGAVINKFTTLMNAHRGQVEAVVTSASKLNPAALNPLRLAISNSPYVGAGKKLVVIEKVVPDIVGGLIVEIGERTIDLSVSTKMAKLNKLLTDTL